MPPPFRLAVTADLHHDVPRSREPCEGFARDFLSGSFDGLLLAGDTCTSEHDHLEQALSLFGDPADGRPRLFVPGNHELWSRDRRRPAGALLREELPRRVRAMGWHWLPGSPFLLPSGWAIVGSGGWFDYAFAEPRLALPTRFYEAGLSPRVAQRFIPRLRAEADDVPTAARDFVARWNDIRFVVDVQDHAEFCRARLKTFEADLDGVSGRPTLAAVHVVPDADLLPRVPDGPVPPDRLKYAFARAYLGSPTFGRAVDSRPWVRHLVCGHSHVPRAAVGVTGCRKHNVGSGYVQKRLLVFSLREPPHQSTTNLGGSI